MIAVDFRGHGLSSRIEGNIELEDLAGDVAAVIKAEDLSSAHIVGVSMGGMVAQHLALLYPRLVRSLILCSTASTFPEDFRSAIKGRGELNKDAGGPGSITFRFSLHDITPAIIYVKVVIPAKAGIQN